MTTPKTKDNPCPAWQDKETLCGNLCLSPNTVDNWVSEGILPPPRKFKGKLMWKCPKSMKC